MSRHLSSLVPGFEGHWYYIEEDAYVGDGKYGKKVRIVCLKKDEELKLHQQVICPAWQVEDVLRNVDRLFPVMERGNAAYWIADHLRGTSLDATYAYQKIEEYLWTILK